MTVPPHGPPGDPGDLEPDVLARTLEVVGGRWSFLILRDLWVLGPRRFGQLQRSLHIARNILSGRLHSLIAEGVVERRLYQRHPERHEYSLTGDGEGLIPALLVLATWGGHRRAGSTGPPMLVRHRNRGHLADPVTVCRVCGDELTIHTLEPVVR